MRFRYVLLAIIITIVYSAAAYVVLVYLPERLGEPAVAGSLPNGFAKAQLVLNSEASIRSGGIELLSGSTLGALGLAAFLTFGAGRKDAERTVRKSQDELFTKALEMVSSADPPVAVGAVSLLGSVAHIRVDLRDATSSALFAIVRQRARVSNTVALSVDDGTIGLLAHREALVSAALKVLGQVPGNYEKEMGGSVVERRLDGCDLRGWEIAGARYEVITFSGTYFCDSSFIDCEFVKCIFEHVDWTGARLRRVRFVECDLNYTNLNSAQGSDVTVEKCLGVEPSSVPQWLLSHQ